MNVKRFTARTSRDALALVRQALGDDAVVLSTKSSPAGVEVLAMAPESLRQVERLGEAAPEYTPTAAAPAPAALPAAALPAASLPPAGGLGWPAARKAPAASTREATRETARSTARETPRETRIEPALETTAVEDDVQRMTMSTLSFQDYVRDRMLKRREAARHADANRDAAAEPDAGEAAAGNVPALPTRAAPVAAERGLLEQRMAERSATVAPSAPMAPTAQREMAPLHDSPPRPSEIRAGSVENVSARHDADDMMKELRSMKGLIEERFGALAFMERMQRQPAQARLTQKLLDCGFSPALIRKLADGLGAEVTDESAWVADILERNLLTSEREAPLEDVGGVYALVGPTGVGKTTTTAKIAAAFATQYGAANLGLITLDAYRVGAHEQLRAYGRILGVPVHTAHDRASLEDLLDLLTAKKMVLIDTAGMAQRDTRTRELLEMVSHRSVQKLLVVNAAAQGETIEDVIVAYRAASCAGIVLSKMDEAVKLGPAIDALIRHRLKVVGVANGQRVPEDWHRLSANSLVLRALRGGGSSAYKLDANDVSLIFTASHAASAPQHAVHA